MPDKITGYDLNNYRVLIFSIYFLYFYIRKKYKCFLALFSSMLLFSVVFIVFKEYILQYSGVLFIVFGLFGVFIGYKDWSYFQKYGISVFDLFFSNIYDKIFTIIMFIVLFAPVFVKYIT